MSYTKPEMQSLGSATSAIQGSTNAKRGCCDDHSGDLATIPAYEADE